MWTLWLFICLATSCDVVQVTKGSFPTKVICLEAGVQYRIYIKDNNDKVVSVDPICIVNYRTTKET